MRLASNKAGGMKWVSKHSLVDTHGQARGTLLHD